MKLGFLTAALPGMTLDEIATWAEASGFGMLEIACWPMGKAVRRYGGVTHIDVATLDKAGAKEIRSMLSGHGLDISSLAYYPNPLDADPEHRETVTAHLKKVIDAAV
jgi:sugar phosphate isomerase/epimerase